MTVFYSEISQLPCRCKIQGLPRFLNRTPAFSLSILSSFWNGSIFHYFVFLRHSGNCDLLMGIGCTWGCSHSHLLPPPHPQTFSRVTSLLLHRQHAHKRNPATSVRKSEELCTHVWEGCSPDSYYSCHLMETWLAWKSSLEGYFHYYYYFFLQSGCCGKSHCSK